MKKISVLSLLFLLLSCSQEPPAGDQPKESGDATLLQLSDEQIKNAGVASALPENKMIGTALKLNGRIEVPPQNIVSISVPLGGYLRSTQLLPGMHVKKGDVIATIEDQQYIQIQQDYLTAQARLKFLRSDFERQTALNENKATSDKILQQSEADYRSELILVKALKEKLLLIGIAPTSLDENSLSRSIRITAPIDGFVSAVNVNIGKYVNPSEVLFELVNPADIHLALNVFEKDLDRIAVGQRVEAYTNAHPEKRYRCEVILVSRNFSADRSVQVHCHFNEYDHALLPGMYMNAEVEVAAAQSFVLPEEAIVNYEGKSYVFLDLGDKGYKLSEVQPGPAEAGSVAVSGLSPHQKVVTRGAYTLLMALKNKAEE